MMKSLAARIHESNHTADRLEMELLEVVIRACGDLSCGDAEEWTTDHYDNSIEVYGVGDIDLDLAAAELKKSGFARVWLHQHPPPRGNCRCPCR